MTSNAISQTQPSAKRRRPRGAGCLFLRGKIWWLKYSINSETMVLSSKSTKRAVAAGLLKVRSRQFEEDPDVAKTLKVTTDELFQDVVADYQKEGLRSIDDLRTRWNLHLKPVFGGRAARGIKPAELTAYQAKRRESGASVGLVNREMSVLRRMFSLGIENEKLTRAPKFGLPQERNVRTGFLEDGEYMELVAGSELWFHALLETAINLGWRHGELLDLKVSQVDLAGHSIRLDAGQTKNKRPRVAHMPESLRVLISACIAGKQSHDFVFTRPSGQRIRDFRATWHARCCAAGLGKLSCLRCQNVVDADRYCATCDERFPHNQLKYTGRLFHDLRRTAVRNMVRNGVSENVAMTITGHQTRSVFDRDDISSEVDLADAAAKMEERNQQRNGTALSAKLQLSYNPPENGAVAKGPILH